MNQLFKDLERLTSITREGNYLHIVSENGDKIIEVKDFAPALADALAGDDFGSRLALHNDNNRHKILTDEYTLDEILENLASGDISDIHAGDIINRPTPSISVTGYEAQTNTPYIILGINGLSGYGDTPISGNHLVMMPLEGLGNAYMNATNDTTGAYKNSYMHQTVMPAVNVALEAAFGNHLKTTREWLSNAMTSTYASKGGGGRTGATSNGEWADCKARLMTELEVYGCDVWSSSGYDSLGGINHQFAAFRDENVLNRRFYWWLSAVNSSAFFCLVHSYGYASSNIASGVLRVRPRFVIQ